MEKWADKFGKVVSGVLLVFNMIFISFQVIQLVWITFDSFSRRFREVGMDYAPEYGRTVAVLFFNILLTMEIMETVRVFAHNHIIKLRVILIVCLIAVSRKILALGEHAVDPFSELALAALMISLAGGYFLVSRFSNDPVEEKEKNENKNY